MSLPSNLPHSRLDIAQRPLAQAGDLVSEPVGLRPEQHFQGAVRPAGRGVRLSVRPGFDLSVYELDAEGRPPVSATTQPCLAIVVLLSGGGEGQIDPNGDTPLPPTPYRAGHLYISLARETVTGTARAVGGEPFRLVELRLSLAFLERMGALGIFTQADVTHRLHHASNARLWLGIAPAPRAILTDAQTMFRDVLDGAQADLRIESRALSLFETVLDLMRTGTPTAMSAAQPMRDATRLDGVRQAMRRDLAHPWTIAELARLAGLNDKRLKAGYRARFGRPVHADLQTMRVEQGRLLLLDGASVTEASLTVGYANPSHFARLFRRVYGMTPNQCR